jgi:hypothetical protein
VVVYLCVSVLSNLQQPVLAAPDQVSEHVLDVQEVV